MLEELERLRIKARNKILTGILISILVSIIIVIFILARGGSFFGLYTIIFTMVIGSIITFLVTGKDRKAFSDMYKREIVLTTFNKICNNVTFNLNNGIARNVVAQTEMLYMGDSFTSNDLITGQYKNINFVTSDVRITETHTDSDGNSYTEVIFYGQWFIFDFNKEFKANIQVCSSNFRNATRNNLFRRQEEKFKKVELEDINFNKNFRVYAQHELDAFYVLTPNTMERIMNLKFNTRGSLLLCFIDNKLHVGLNNGKDLFEASVFKKVNLEEATQKTLSEISIITNFVDTLSLDNDLFKRKEGGVN
jgi:hypothetical protein